MGTLFTALGAAAALSVTDIIPVHQGGARAVGLTGTQLLTLVGTTYVPLAGGTMTGRILLDSTESTGGIAGADSPSGAALIIRGGNTEFFNSGGYRTGLFASTGFRNSSDGEYGWSFSTDAAAASDLKIVRDAASTLAQRNGTTQQIFRLYNTYTDSSNYERLTLTGVAGTSVNITAETLGTGADNLDIVLTPAGTGALKVGALDSGANFLRENVSGFGYGMGYYSSGIVLGKNADPAMWIKQAEVRITSTVPVAWASSGWSGSIDTAFHRGAAGQVDVTNGTAGTYRDLKLRNLLNTEYHEMTEMTAPAAGAANTARIFAVDNGSGKTKLMVQFATGAAQQLAIEP